MSSGYDVLKLDEIRVFNNNDSSNDAKIDGT